MLTLVFRGQLLFAKNTAGFSEENPAVFYFISPKNRDTIALL